MLFSLAGSIGWLVVWMYNLDHPPTGIVQGSNIHEFMTYAFIIMAIATLFMFFRNRNRGYSGYPRTANEQAEYDRQVKAPPSQVGGLMNRTNEEYRERVRGALRNNRRR